MKYRAPFGNDHITWTVQLLAVVVVGQNFVFTGGSHLVGFPVYATGIVPSTSVRHYRFGGSQIPVTCDGVTVNAGDIVAAVSDGVVVVPKARAQEVLSVAQQMDFKEPQCMP